MAELTNGQVAWFQGFWSFFQGRKRPNLAGQQRDGWDAASSCRAQGGYGAN